MGSRFLILFHIMLHIMLLIMMINIGTVCRLVAAVHLIRATTAAEDPTIHSPDGERRLSHVAQIFFTLIFEIFHWDLRFDIWYSLFEINYFQGRRSNHSQSRWGEMAFTRCLFFLLIFEIKNLTFVFGIHHIPKIQPFRKSWSKLGHQSYWITNY